MRLGALRCPRVTRAAHTSSRLAPLSVAGSAVAAHASAPSTACIVLGGEALSTLHLPSDALALAVDRDLQWSAGWLLRALGDAMDGAVPSLATPGDRADTA